MTSDDILAQSFRALSHPRRAALFRLLAMDPSTGDTLGGLQETSGISHTSLIHHLREMERCGLIRRKRRGAEVSYLLDTSHLARAMGVTQSLVMQSRLEMAS